jgi:hypothetical protein
MAGQEQKRTSQQISEEAAVWADTPEAKQAIQELNAKGKIISKELHEMFKVDPNDPALRITMS